MDISAGLAEKWGYDGRGARASLSSKRKTIVDGREQSPAIAIELGKFPQPYRTCGVVGRKEDGETEVHGHTRQHRLHHAGMTKIAVAETFPESSAVELCQVGLSRLSCELSGGGSQ